MDERARAARAAYQRAWRKKNPERVRAIHERYWQNKAESYQQEEAQREETSHE